MNRKRLAIAAAAVATASLLATPGTASAIIPKCYQNVTCLYDYYDGPGFDKLVGFTEVDCLGDWTTHGTATRWVTFRTIPCR